MIRYLIIESKNWIQSDEDMIISLFSEFIHFTGKENDDNAIHLFYEHETEISLSDIILNVMSDTLLDLRLYVSHHFEKTSEMKEHLKMTKKLLKGIPFYKYAYLDDQIILNHFITQTTPEFNDHFLRKYQKDQMMLESIKTFLECNQNTSIAAKRLYIHRNTLIQRLDKFMIVTGFDVRQFKDAYLIYHLLK